MAVRLIASPLRAAVDEPLAVRVEGLARDVAVTLRARASKPDAAWIADATFVADGVGTVDVARDAPVGGAYEGVDPTGLIWAMAAEGERRPVFGTRGTIALSLTAEVDGRAVAAASLERLPVPDDVVETELRADGMVGALFRPAAGAPHPAVVVLGGSGGGTPWQSAALLARHGFAVLALAYFGVDPLAPGLRAIPLEYFAVAFDWLAGQPGVRDDGVGIVGTSRGGELVLLLGATDPRVRAVVAYVPSHVVWDGLGPARERGPSAWTLGGEPIPWLSEAPPTPADRAWPADVPYPLTPRFLAALADRDAEARAAIPVERIEGRVLLISGREDAMWPSALMAERAAARMAAHGKGDRVTHLCYEGAGHTIGYPYVPTALPASVHPVVRRLHAYGGTPAGIARARADSWPRAIGFLRDALVG